MFENYIFEPLIDANLGNIFAQTIKNLHNKLPQ